MAHRFPLLHLPYLGFEKSIKLMDIGDQFALSKASKRSQRVVKCVLRNRKYDATLEFKKKELKVDMHAFEDTKSLTLVALIDTTDVELIKDSINRLTDAFTIKDISLVLRDDCLFISPIIKFVKQLGMPYSVIVTGMERDREPILYFVLEQCGDARKLDLHIPALPQLAPNPEDFPPFQCSSVTLRHSSWITLYHMTAWFMSCRHISLFRCPLTRYEVNRFLKRWQKGSKIEHIELSYLYVINYTLENALEGIQATPAQAVSVQQESISIPGSYNGFIIEQDNDQQAFVHLQHEWVLMMHVKFELEKEDK